MTDADPTNGGRRVYVGNLAPTIHEAELRTAFVAFNITRVDMKHGFAFIEFSTRELAAFAASSMDTKELGGRRLVVEVAKGTRQTLKQRRESGRGKWRIHFEELPHQTSWQDVKDYARAAAAGPITFADVWTANGKKYGVVEYLSEHDMNTAVKKLRGALLGGEKVRMHTGKRGSRSRSRSGSRDRRRSRRSRSRSRDRSESRSRSPSSVKPKGRPVPLPTPEVTAAPRVTLNGTPVHAIPKGATVVIPLPINQPLPPGAVRVTGPPLPPPPGAPGGRPLTLQEAHALGLQVLMPPPPPRVQSALPPPPVASTAADPAQTPVPPYVPLQPMMMPFMPQLPFGMPGMPFQIPMDWNAIALLAAAQAARQNGPDTSPAAATAPAPAAQP